MTNLHLVTEAFDRLSANRTLIVASHQLKVVANADTILVLQDGWPSREPMMNCSAKTGYMPASGVSRWLFE